MKPYGISNLKMTQCDGHRVDDQYQEILKLDRMLDEAGIYHELFRILDGWGVIYYGHGDDYVADAVQHYASYGGPADKLEIMGLCDEDCGDSVQGWLTAENVFDRWKRHWESMTNVKEE